MSSASFNKVSIHLQALWAVYTWTFLQCANFLAPLSGLLCHVLGWNYHDYAGSPKARIWCWSLYEQVSQYNGQVSSFGWQRLNGKVPKVLNLFASSVKIWDDVLANSLENAYSCSLFIWCLICKLLLTFSFWVSSTCNVLIHKCFVFFMCTVIFLVRGVRRSMVSLIVWMFSTNAGWWGNKAWWMRQYHLGLSSLFT